MYECVIMIALMRDKNIFSSYTVAVRNCVDRIRNLVPAFPRARPFLFPRNNLKFCLLVLFTQRTGYVDRSLLRMKG